jgi:RimJ/RimL family protein N-acetyltransferase
MSVMLSNDLFTGKLVRLAAPTADERDIFARWSNDPEYLRNLDDDPARPRHADAIALPGKDVEWQRFEFRIRTLADNILIGFVELWGFSWNHQSATMSIGIGEPAYRGKGYGTDAIRLILSYAFCELNLHRVGLGVFSYNTRAIRAYEKVGFVREGALRQAIHRDGRRYDMILMGILRPEWEQPAVEEQHG